MTLPDSQRVLVLLASRDHPLNADEIVKELYDLDMTDSHRNYIEYDRVLTILRRYVNEDVVYKEWRQEGETYRRVWGFKPWQ